MIVVWVVSRRTSVVLFQVSVPFWSVEATQQAWVEAEDLMEDSMEDLMEVEVVSHDKTCCHLGCLLN